MWTIVIFVLTILFSMPLGLGVSLLRLSKYKIIQYPVRFYLLIMRGTPLVLQLMFVMYAPPFVFGVPINRVVAAVIAFSLNYAAYFAEIYRAGIQSVPLGQYEAAAVLGFSSRQTFLRIIFPQVIKKILPPVGSEWMVLVKDTALAQTIAVVELFRNATNAMSRYASITPIIVAALFYLAMGALVELLFAQIEKKLNYYKG